MPLTSQSGYALFTTLVFIFVITLMIVSQSNNLITAKRSVADMQQYQQLFIRANDGVVQLEHKILGSAFDLSKTDISLQTKIISQKTDHCGNQIIDIKSYASKGYRKLILRVRDIFARVPVIKGCKPLPRFERIWWREGE